MSNSASSGWSGVAITNLRIGKRERLNPAGRWATMMTMGQVEEGKAYTTPPPAVDVVGGKEPCRSPTALVVS